MQDNEQEQHQYDENLDTLLVYQDPMEVDTPENKESFLKESPFVQKKKTQLAPLENKPSIDEILNSIFQPKKLELDGRYFIRSVSTRDALRDDLRELEGKLEFKLKDSQARYIMYLHGLEKMEFAQLEKIFITSYLMKLSDKAQLIVLKEVLYQYPNFKGLLLVRVRDTLRMTFAAYQTLYSGSVVFGVKKALQSEVGKTDLESRIMDFERKKIFMENKQIILENELDSIQKSFKEIKDLEDKRKENEISYLKHQTKHLEIFLKSVQQSSQ